MGAADGAAVDFRIAGYPVTAPLVGGALVVVSVFLPWIATGGAPSANAFKVPVKLLVDSKVAKPDGLKIGLLLLAVGAAGVVLSTVRPEPLARRVLGAVVVGVCLLFLVQFQRALRGWEFVSVLGNIGLGVPVAIGGGALLWGRASSQSQERT